MTIDILYIWDIYAYNTIIKNPGLGALSWSIRTKKKKKDMRGAREKCSSPSSVGKFLVPTKNHIIVVCRKC